MNEEVKDVIKTVDGEELELIPLEVVQKPKPSKIGIGIGLLAVGGVAAVLYKNRKRFEERKVEKLRKKGYIVYNPDYVEEASDEVMNDDVENENKE